MRAGVCLGFLILSGAGSCWAEVPGMEALMRVPGEMEGTTFGEVVEAATGRRVVPVDLSVDGDWVGILGGHVAEMVAAMNTASHPVQKATRINEASRPVEEELVARLASVPGWTCDFATTAGKGAQRSGYPDIRLQLPGGRVVYIDPKLYAADSRSSSFRSFYYSPKTDTNKILEDARHVIVGIAHADNPDGSRRFTSWEIIDVATMPIHLKLEFQSSNADMYRDEARVTGGGIPLDPDG